MLSCYRITYMFFVLFLMLPVTANAQKDCLKQAGTQLEQVYCKVKAKGAGKMLPSLEDFRRNNKKMQYLMLKRPAQAAGVNLPKIDIAKKVERKRKVKELAVSKDNRRVNTKSAVDNKKSDNTIRYRKVVVRQDNWRDRCAIKKSVLQCQDKIFNLQPNRSNKSLSPGALTSSNTLGLPLYRGKLTDPSALNKYMAKAYEIYLKKMLSIGLGASTMSYTKFYYTYLDVAKKGEDVRSRMEKMFAFLKKDKSSMAIKSFYTKQHPKSLTQCMKINSYIVACDNTAINWVYLSEK